MALARPIGKLNCRHIIYSIILGVSEPNYSEAELQAMKEASLKKTEFDGRKMTTYEATQAQRRLEREIRKQKNRSVLAASAGDDEMRREAQMKINQLTGKYKDLSDTFGLKTKAERMQVSGYRPVKEKKKLPEAKNLLISPKASGFDKNNSQIKPDPWDRSKIDYSVGGKSLQRRLNRAKVEYNEVKLLDKLLSEEEIISRIGGYDMTSGSCFSLACAYIGNKHGLDVIDYRGGDSAKIFSEGFMNVTHLKGVTGKYSHKSDLDQVKKLLNMMEEGKEYMLTAGQHTTIVRLNNGIPEYLALQGRNKDNGWFPFERDFMNLNSKSVYHRPFDVGVKETFMISNNNVQESSLIDIDMFKGSDEFRDLLGYINTEEKKQKKL